MLEATGRSCGWTKGPVDIKKHCGGMMMLVVVLVRRGNYGRIGGRETNKEKYLEAKKKAGRTVYQAKCKAERKRFGRVMWRNDQKRDVFKIAKRIVKTNQDITGEQCIRNDNGVLAVSDENKKIAWKSYHKKLLNTELAWIGIIRFRQMLLAAYA